MARFHPFLLFNFIFIAVLFASLVFSKLSEGFLASSEEEDANDFSNIVLFHQDYSPPAPPPPPPRPPSVSCTDDLGGIGSLDSTCQILSDVFLSGSVYVQGEGNVYIHSGVNFHCSFSGCSINVEISGNFTLSENASVRAGDFKLSASNANFLNGSVVNTTALAGPPPSQTSGTPQGLDGAGGGHGGRGACCVVDSKKLPEDVWGGDAYSWSSLQNPYSYGSRGGSTSKETNYGGLGGGRLKIAIKDYMVVDGFLLADGGDGGSKGGGGSGGSVYIQARKMTGTGRISACGGDGFGGGGGGRVSVEILSRHDEPQILVHGGRSRGCPKNAGAAGTLYDAVLRSLIVDNNNMTTDTETLLLDFPNQPLWTNFYVCNYAMATVPLLWSRVQVQGQISLLHRGVLSFGLAHYASSEFELLAEELLMSDSIIKVYGALRMTVKMFLMWNAKMSIEGADDASVATSVLEASNLVVLRESSIIRSNANLGVHGQGLLNLSGPGDLIEAQRLVLSLFYSIHVGPGSVLRGPLENATNVAVIPRLQCEQSDCPIELLYPPEDCNVNSSLSFTVQICRVEDISVKGLVKGSVIHFHRTRTISVSSSGMISAAGMGCTGGVGRGKILSNGIGSGGGHGGKGGLGCYNGSCIEGGASYGNAELPCEVGSGSGEENKAGSLAGGGIIVMGSVDHPLSSLIVQGSVVTDGDGFQYNDNYKPVNDSSRGFGGGSGGTVLLFLQNVNVGESGILSSVGGHGSRDGGGGGGGGGRIHFHWSDIPSGDVYQPIATVEGNILIRGGSSIHEGGLGEEGTVTGRSCPKGLYGTFCEECHVGTYKNVTGSDRSLCLPCPSSELPGRAVYVSIRGGITELPCPYRCVSDRFHLPHCYTALEELIYTFGGPWLFCFLLIGLLVLLALVLSVARMKFVGLDELPGPAPTQQGSQIDQSFPFLESLNEVLETSRTEESQNHVHRMYFMGPNSFSEPWHLSYTIPHQIREIVYEDAFNRFVDEINATAAYQWWEGAIYSILCIIAYPLAWSWKQWRLKVKLQRLREFVRSEYDHSCLRSCRSRALYEGLKVAATSDLMLAYVDFFLGGDEKRSNLLLRLQQRFPMSVVFGGDGSYMSPFFVHNDNILTNLISQLIPPTVWHRTIAGLNAQLRLVRRGQLRTTFRPVLGWIQTHANPALGAHGVCIDLAWFPASASGYCQYGLLVYAAADDDADSSNKLLDSPRAGKVNRLRNARKESLSGQMKSKLLLDEGNGNPVSYTKRRRCSGTVIDGNTLPLLQEKRDKFFLLSFVICNTKPVGHQDLVGLVISMLLLGDFSLVLLTLLQLYSISLLDVILVLCILPFGILLPFPAGINALFSHGPRRSAGLTRIYALWNANSLINVLVAFICGYVNYHSKSTSSKMFPFQPWNISMDESEWWIFPSALVLFKIVQSQLVNWHVANLEMQDRSLYSNDFELFWQS